MDSGSSAFDRGMVQRLRQMLDQYVFYTDTPTDKEQQFRDDLHETTVEMAFPLFGFFAGIVLIFWPTDFLLFQDSTLLTTYVIWRSTVVLSIGVLLTLFTYSEWFRRHANLAIVLLICVNCLGIGYSFARFSGFSAPWFWAILVIPWITIFLGLTPIYRLISTLAIISSWIAVYTIPFPKNLTYPHLPTVGVLLSGMVVIITVCGHVMYHFFRKDFFNQQKLQEKKGQLQKLARHDQLTGLYDRRFFEARLEEEFQRAKRYDLDLSLLMMDLDHFKKINDTFGHPAGDEVLSTFGTMIQDEVRSTDIAGRYGGEEFSIAMPETSLEGAIRTGERLREKLNQHSFRTDEGEEFSVTCSLGLAGFRLEMNNFSDFVKEADDALYQAKEGGRNQLIVADLSSGS
jgi:diguanylate cyclase (GGDEF)-like protein